MNNRYNLPLTTTQLWASIARDAVEACEAIAVNLGRIAEALKSSGLDFPEEEDSNLV